MSLLGFDALGRLALGQLPSTVTPTALVFSSFSQPSFKSKTDLGSINFRVLLPDGPTPSTLVFSKFSEPSKTKIVDTSTSFVAVLPSVIPVFSSFSQPTTTTQKNSDVSASFFAPTVVVAPSGGDFSDFDLIQSKKNQQVGFTNSPIFIAPQSYVFSTFSLPLFKKTAQDQSVSFALQPQTVAVVPPYTGFSIFSTPQRPGRVTVDVTNSPQVTTPPVVQNYSFGLFSQPQTTTRLITGFNNTPTPVVVQPYIFSKFEQPLPKRSLQVDSVQFTEQPPVIVLLSDFTFSDFGVPFKTTKNGITFSNAPLLPLAVVSNTVAFTGFTDFGAILHPYAEQHPSVVYLVAVPPPFIPAVNPFAGKTFTQKAKPKVVPLNSSNIAEVVYDKDSNELNVKFNNGKVYNYTNIDGKKAKGLVRAKSSGKYLHNNIKGKYFTTRIK